MTPTITTFLFEIANFLVLLGVLGYFFFKPVRQALDDRRQRFAAEDQQAAQKLAEAQQLQQRLATEHARLQQELNEMRRRETEAAAKQAAQILADARDAADRERAQSQLQLARLGDRQRDSLAEASALAAGETVGRLLDSLNAHDLQAMLVESACQQLGSLPQTSLGKVKIESAHPLAAEHYKSLMHALGPAADAADFRTVNGLGAGVRISTGSGLIDASVSGLANFAKQSLLKEMRHRSANHTSEASAHDE